MRSSGTVRASAVRDHLGNVQTDPDSIGDVFVKFYEDLYKEVQEVQDNEPGSVQGALTLISSEDIATGLKRLKNQKTGAEDGLVAEMLKTNHQGLIDAIAEMFTDIVNGSLEPPEEWKRVKLTLIFKSGDKDVPKNYRPISIIPVLAKLFSTVLYEKIRDVIDLRLDDEQFGFRRGRGCTDAIHILRMVVEKSAEWGEELWIAALDVEKAFDRVHHSDMFAALMNCRVNVNVVAALRKLYQGLSAYVVLWPGAESRAFAVERGVRQGDPLSPLLFNLVLNEVLEEVGAVWQRRGYGTNIGRSIDGKRLTHIAFADDMSIISRSWLSLKRMVLMVRKALKKRGLSLHPAKCKTQTNLEIWSQRGNVCLDEDFSIEVLPEGGGLKILGTTLALINGTAQEVQNRISAGWKQFWSMKKLLLNRKISINRRLKLFESTVTSCVLWSCQSWTPRAEELRQLESARRSMLRRIVSGGRAPDEDWLEWVKRLTRKSIQLAKDAGVREWTRAHATSKWLWAGHVARCPADSWTWRVTTWRDAEWQVLANEAGSSRPLRPSTRRWMRWEDRLRRHCATRGLGSWMGLAMNRHAWADQAKAFGQSYIL
jgi:hypothetical protein